MADAAHAERSGSADGLSDRGHELTAKMCSLAPIFRGRAEAAEEARSLPAESIVELVESRIASTLVPQRFDGYELGLDTWLDLTREAARGDASHGWCAMLLAHCAHMVTFFPDEAQTAIWGQNPNVAIAGSVHPAARAEKRPGGYRVSTESPFASGVNHSSWVFVGGIVDRDGAQDRFFFLLPVGAYEIADTWHTSGMRGTGSNTIVARDVLVPEEHTLLRSALLEGDAPGSAVNSGRIYQLPFMSYAPLGFAAVMLGAAQGALDYFQDWLLEQIERPRPTVGDQTAIYVRMGQAAADLDAAQLLLTRAVEATQQDGLPSLELRARTMRDAARASEWIVNAIDTLIALSGTAAFASASPLQRAWRDIHFAATHISLKPDINCAHWTRTELGLQRPPTQMHY